jgi:hypothetical protein
VFVNHAYFRDNANGVTQTCHIGCPQRGIGSASLSISFRWVSSGVP